MAIMAGFLWSDHVLDASAVFTAALAAMFGIPILQRTEGLIRRLLVAIPAAAVMGVYGYFYDMFAKHVFSHVIGAIFQTPANSAFYGELVAILTFLGALAAGVTAEGVKDKLTPGWAALAFLVGVPAWTITNTITFEVAVMVWRAHNQPPLYAVVAFAGILSLYIESAALYALRLQRKGFDSAGCLGITVLLLNLALLLGLGILSIVAFTVLLGWVFWIFFGIAVVILLALRGLQTWADNMKPAALGYLTFIFVLLTAGLQALKVFGS
jgi:hypothetical protein